LARPFEIVLASPAHDFQTVFQVNTHRLFQAQVAWFAVHQRQHDDAERGLHRRMLEQIPQRFFGVGRFGQLDHHPHSLAIRLVTQVGDSIHLLLAHQVGNPLD